MKKVLLYKQRNKPGKYQPILIKLLGFCISLLMMQAGQLSLAIELPDIGASAGAVISPEKERMLGSAFYRQLQGAGAILDDPETIEYLQSLGTKLVINSDGAGNPFTFFPVASLDINAFAAPGGFIGINAGLIIRTETESELAGVLAHEVSHVTQHHMARAFEKAGQLSIPVAVALIGALILATQSPDAGQASLLGVLGGSAQQQIDFTRANEKEADRVGMALLSRAGFEPEGMPAFFKRLQIANRLTDPKFLPEFLRTHPVTTSRIADATNRLNEYPPSKYKDSLEYQLTKARLVALASDSPRKQAKNFKRDLEDGEYTNEDATRYGYSIALSRAGKFKQARRELERLLSKDGENTSYRLASADVEMQAGQYEKALGIYASLEKDSPNYPPLVINYAEALLQLNQLKKAKNLLLDYAIYHGKDVKYYSLLAEAEGRLGATAESHLALAEYHYLSGNTQQALQQLKIAERSDDLGTYQRQRLATRKEQFEKLMEEEKELQ